MILPFARYFKILGLLIGLDGNARVVETSQLMIAAPTRLAVEVGRKVAAQDGNADLKKPAPPVRHWLLSNFYGSIESR
jgi:hypothetical protein